MTALVWDQAGDRRYETGSDRGVLYVPGGDAVPWNGLVSVQEKPEGGTITSYHFDGQKYLDVVSNQDYRATLEAFTYPDEFEQFDGAIAIEEGVYATYQPRSTFGLSYRTKVGNDLNGDLGYKLHLVYNAIASPSPKQFVTMAQAIRPVNFMWDIVAVPEVVPGHKPTAHLVIDTSKITDPNIIAEIEIMLYGSPLTAAYLPTPTEIVDLLSSWPGITITDNGDGTWTATGPSALITMLDLTEFQITDANATYLDADTYEISSSP